MSSTKTRTQILNFFIYNSNSHTKNKWKGFITAQIKKTI